MNIIAIHGRYKDIFDISLRTDIQPDIAVKTAVSQIIDHIANRRDLRVFCAVEFYGNDIFACFELLRDIDPERRITAIMLANRLIVQKDFCNMCCTVKL